MKLWIAVWAGAVSLAMGGACAGGSDSPAGSDTETSTDASSSFSTTSTSDDSTTTNDSQSSDSNDATSTTADTADSTSSGGSSSGSTGCVDGAEGCRCRADDPACDDGFECVDQVCSAGFCESEDDEPNDDAPGESIELGDLDDTAGPENVTSQLNGPDDVDWLMYSCNDTIGDDVDPTLIIDQNVNMRVCFFMDCEFGGNPLFDCPDGSTSEQGPFDFLPGCCVTDGSTLDMATYNCPDNSNDSIINWIRVDMAETMQCEPYSLTYNC